ncbi:unnamed protein product [Meloidogyne enterolobii]|uniref:Uncharacterized protein n=1 Tax=Meloidogyne enterolobii TaxID=390850 RepID=A0ACB0Z2U5_MELEN
MYTISSSSPLFLHCPRASPEATGSSLNSPSSPPPLSTNFVNKSVEEEGEQQKNEDLLLKELAAEGDAECLLIASWLESNNNNCVGSENNNKDGINNNDGLVGDISETQRPRFSLDRLVPPELQLETTKPIQSIEEKQICGDFSLQKSSPRGQCQGTVYVHFHHEKNNFDIKIKKEGEENGEQKRIINLNKKKRRLLSINNNNFVVGNEQRNEQNEEVSYQHQQIQKEKEENKSSINQKISPYSTSPSLRSGVTLLEQLVKSHPIWFLPHLNRQEASHLLRHQEPGVFIVRGSSRIINNNNNSFTNSDTSASFHSSTQRSSISVMALSVKLPPPKEEEENEDGNNEDKLDTDQLDHFLLEAVGSGQSVRLQGSVCCLINKIFVK